MPGTYTGTWEEARGRTTDDLISRVAYSSQRCAEDGCQMCMAQREVLTARISTSSARLSNHIEASQFTEIRELLERTREDGITPTTVESTTRGLEERVADAHARQDETPEDVAAAFAAGQAVEERFIAGSTGPQLDVITEEQGDGGWYVPGDNIGGNRVWVPEADIIPTGFVREQEEAYINLGTEEQRSEGDQIIQDWYNNRVRRDAGTDDGAERQAVSSGPASVVDDPVQSGSDVAPCSCASCVRESTPTTGAGNSVQRSTQRDDRRTAAAARLP